MTLRDFENGYWYLDQLKNFAERIGPSCEEAAKTRLRSFSRKITWFYACRASVASTGMNNNGAFAVRIETGVRRVVVGRQAPARALDTAPKQADAP